MCGNRTRYLTLEVMMGSLEFGNGEPLFNFKQMNLIQTLGAGETLVNETDKTPCPPVAYRLICVSKRSLSGIPGWFSRLSCCLHLGS